MKRYLFILFQSIAISLLLAHSVLPHQHHTQLSHQADILQHQQAHSLLDYLKIAFHTDLGKGHLESFILDAQTQDAPVKQLLQAIAQNSYPAPSFPFVAECPLAIGSPSPTPLAPNYVAQMRPLRAPPMP